MPKRSFKSGQHRITFAEGVLGILTYYSGGWRTVRKYVNGEAIPRREARKYVISDRTITDASMRATLSRLKKLGYVQSNDGEWNITKVGREYLTSISQLPCLPAHTLFDKCTDAIKSNSDKRVIVSFDIPEVKQQSRRWLRVELGLLGFEMLQQSVWIGPAPLPDGFIACLQEMEILECIKFFKVSETDVV